MIVEGVNFNDAICSKMTEDEFVAVMMPVHFQDRKPKQRERMLRDIYAKMAFKV